MPYFRVVTDAVTGEVTQIPFTPEEEAAHEAASRPKESDYADAVQEHIDATARAKQYADGFALASYVNSTVFQWATEAATFVAWRDQVWLYAYTQLAAVQQGSREPPTVQDLVAELPLIQWPT